MSAAPRFDPDRVGVASFLKSGTGPGPRPRPARLRPAGGTDDPPRIRRVDPAFDAAGVFRDAPVLLSLSHAVDAHTADPRTVAVADAEGVVPARVETSPDGRLVIWRAERLLTPGELHLVFVDGLRDARGRTFAPWSSRFVPCALVSSDVG